MHLPKFLPRFHSIKLLKSTLLHSYVIPVVYVILPTLLFPPLAPTLGIVQADTSGFGALLVAAKHLESSTSTPPDPYMLNLEASGLTDLTPLNISAFLSMITDSPETPSSWMTCSELPNLSPAK